ncbi:MAG: hypothetical protein JXR07_20560 [Reichenbachiella sp.]
MNAEQRKKMIDDNPISSNLKDKFKVVGVIPGPIKHKGVQYDLRKMSTAVADKLASDEGFIYLEKKSSTGSQTQGVSDKKN